MPTRAELAEKLAVYLVADPNQTERDLVEDVVAALEGGVTSVQLRAKRATDREALALAVRLREACRERDALFVVNDRVDLALAAGADGVHLGVHDLPLAAARAIAGSRLVLGYAPLTLDQVDAAAGAGADYVGLGPVFATASKEDATPPIGLPGLAAHVAATPLPAVGIGGITAENAGDVIRAGAVGVSVISAILRAPDPREAAARLAQAVAAARRGARLTSEGPAES